MQADQFGLRPFLKWAGGKRWLAETLAPYFEQCSHRYFEPFLGSGAVFFRYLPQKASLGDANAELINCYVTLRDDYRAVETALRELAKMHPDESYYDVRSWSPDSAVESAARFLYLNRTCWNGLYRVNLRGEFNVPRGTKTQILLDTDDFASISNALQGADLAVRDFEETLSGAGEGDFVFADPPYTVAHNLNGFVKYNQSIFSWDDQIRLAKALDRAANRGARVVCTNADHAEVRTLYATGWNAQPVYRASVIAAASGNRRRTSELFLTNTCGAE